MDLSTRHFGPDSLADMFSAPDRRQQTVKPCLARTGPSRATLAAEQAEWPVHVLPERLLSLLRAGLDGQCQASRLPWRALFQSCRRAASHHHSSCTRRQHARPWTSPACPIQQSRRTRQRSSFTVSPEEGREELLRALARTTLITSRVQHLN